MNERMHEVEHGEDEQASGSISILTSVELTSHGDYNLSTQNFGITLFFHE